MTKQQEKELDKKLDLLSSLKKKIELHEGQMLTVEKKAQFTAIQNKLEFRLNELVYRSKCEEADIRADIFEETLKVLNQSV